MGIVVSRIKIIFVMLMLVIWLISCGLSYRYAQQQVELTALRDFQTEVVSANVKQRKMLNEFEKISVAYAIEQEQRMADTAQMEHYIYEYLQAADDSCRIDDSGVQLINQLIQQSNPAAG